MFLINRRDLLKEVAGVGLAAALPSQTAPGAQGERLPQREVARSWHVGYAEAEITPAPGEAMLAGFGRPRHVQGTLTPLRAQVLALRDRSGRRALLIVADVLGFERISIDALRHKIQEAHDLPASGVCFAATHTHWGPGIQYRMNFTLSPLNVWYVARLEETLLKLADEALQDLSSARLTYGASHAQIGMCRRLRNDQGEFGWGPNPDGSYDPHTPILHITRGQSPTQLVLVGHACHPTSTGLIGKWSPDYPGALRRKLETALDDCRALFVMGCGGDAKVVHRDAGTAKYAFAADPEDSKAAGEKLADHVLLHVREGQWHMLDAELETRRVSGALSLQSPRSRAEIDQMAISGDVRSTRTWWARQSLAYPDSRRTERYDVQTWRLGNLTVIALEGEVCADWGPMTRALAMTPHAMAIAYANACPGYIPTARIIREGGYEGDTSHMAYFLPAPFAPQTEIELTTLVQRALGRTDHGAGLEAPVYEDKTALLGYLGSDGTMHAIRTADQWATRRLHILANWQRMLGPLPGPAFRVQLDLKVVDEEKRDGYTRQRITYNVDPYDRVESYVLLPHERHSRMPAIIALHSTHPTGKDRAVTPDGNSGRQYGHELAQRGYIVIVPDYWPHGHYRSKRYNPYQRGYASGAIKGVWNHMRAIDVLQSLPDVDVERIGSIGHSLGGYNTLFLGVFDTRVKAMVSSAGYNSFDEYASSTYGGGDLKNWAGPHDKHMRRITTVYDNDPREVPSDFPELVAALAPRPLLTIAPKNDHIFVLPGVTKCLDAARPVYELLGAGARLQVRFPNAGHDFPKAEREVAYEFLDTMLGRK